MDSIDAADIMEGAKGRVKAAQDKQKGRMPIMQVQHIQTAKHPLHASFGHCRTE
jgi:hypothetical protein